MSSNDLRDRPKKTDYDLLGEFKECVRLIATEDKNGSKVSDAFYRMDKILRELGFGWIHERIRKDDFSEKEHAIVHEYFFKKIIACIDVIDLCLDMKYSSEMQKKIEELENQFNSVNVKAEATAKELTNVGYKTGICEINFKVQDRMIECIIMHNRKPWYKRMFTRIRFPDIYRVNEDNFRDGEPADVIVDGADTKLKKQHSNCRI